MGAGEPYGSENKAFGDDAKAELKGEIEFLCGARERKDEKQEIVCGVGKCYRGSPPKNGGFQL